MLLLCCKRVVCFLLCDRVSVQLLLIGLKRKLGRCFASPASGQAEEQELLRLREENHSLRGQCLSLVALLGRPSIALAATTHMMMHRCWICSLAFESAPI